MGAEPLIAASLDITPVDTTGAGDAFNAGLVTGLSAGFSMTEAIELGVRAGAFCVTRLGVIEGLPTRQQLDAEVPVSHVDRLGELAADADRRGPRAGRGQTP